MQRYNSIENTNKMSKLGEELSAAVALTTLGGPSHLNPLLQNQVPLGLLQVQRQPPGLTIGQIERTAVTPSNNKVKRNFPQKLFDLLETRYHSDIVRWLPGGKAFIVLDKRRFANEILPAYFKESQYTSFTRKLSRWKFTRVSRGPYMGAYYHKNFRSDNRLLCRLMSCNNSKVAKKTDKVEEESTLPEETTIETEQNEVGKPSQNEESDKTEPPFESPFLSNGPCLVSNKAEQGDSERHAAQAMTIENNLDSTNHNILLIKQQLMEIRLRKAKVEEKKHLLMMQAEAMRLKEIQRLRSAVNLSIQQAETRILAAAARAIGTSNMNPHSALQSVMPNSLPSWYHQCNPASLAALNHIQARPQHSNNMSSTTSVEYDSEQTSPTTMKKTRAFAA
jgi:hypothetical protein